MICSYCGSENRKYVENCGFCAAPLKKQRPQLKEFLFLEQAELPFGELSIFHTYDLLILLRLVREERSSTYNLLRMTRKVSQEVAVDLESLAFAEEEYRRYTARMKVIEGILIDRMGYKPKRVDDKLLSSLKGKIEGEKSNG
ncbi:hypothetical protein JMM81_21920 [Bacillus sp. V3B]|uniref:hypothetical protein n=1 Tax=Bacillus sp. V3B TaxID=2804915 RepID=UPI00210EEDBD|nr:hypothetical protein [Bacillus sp. V3B]MCQ6277520.1 hypothetical protein [Bacillus sp. V3B]